MTDLLTVYVPILVPLPSPLMDEVWHQHFDRAVSDLNGESFEVSLSASQKVTVKVEYSPTAQDWPDLSSVWEVPNLARKVHFLRFCSQFEIPLVETPPEFEVSRAVIAQDIACADLAKAVADLVVAMNIARPGVLDTLEGFGFVNGRLMSRTRPLRGGYLQEAMEIVRHLNWPPVEYIGIQETWRWVSKIPGLPDGIPRGKAGRAFAAVTYLHEGDHSLSLVWALLGLEAIYGQGNHGVKEQLIGKAIALLGSPESNKKVFGQAYDFRSRLVHGDIDLPVAYTPYDALPQFEKYETDLVRSGALTITVLLSTLQKLISVDSYDLTFSYMWEQA